MPEFRNDDSHKAVDGDEIRAAMRYWATGVAIVSTLKNQEQHGMTVNSFTSISLNPPFIVVTLENTARTYNLIKASGVFGVTILSSKQEVISNRFAGRDTENKDRFDGIKTETLSTGSPFIKGGMAYFDCRVTSSHPAGTNTLIVAEVIATKIDTETNLDDPLLYYSREYRQLKV